MKKAAYISLFALAASLHAGETISEALKNTQISGYAKLMYIFDDRKGPKLDQSTWGAGGKIGATSGDWHGLKAKIAYYQTSDLGLRSKNPKETDAYMFDVDKSPYSVIGEKYIEYSAKQNTVTLGRQEIDTPIISTYDYRIIPNLFEAYTLTNKDIKDTTLTLSYVTKMSGLDGLVSFKKFESMSEQTYTSLNMTTDLQTIDNSESTINVSKISGHQGVIMLGALIDANPKISLWNYYCKDVSNTFYAEGAIEQKITEKLTATYEAQGYSVRAIGKFKDFLSNLGLNGSYELYGLKSSIAHKESGISGYIAANLFTGDSKTVTAFGNWGGYPEFVSIPYMFAQDSSVSAVARLRAAKAAIKYEISSKQSIIAGYSYIDLDKNIMSNSDIKLLNLIYKAKIMKALSAKIQYELRDSKNYRYDNDMLTLSATYTF